MISKSWSWRFNYSTRHLRGAIVAGLFPSSLAASLPANLAASLVEASAKGDCRRIEDRSMLEPTIELDRFHRPIDINLLVGQMSDLLRWAVIYLQPHEMF